jgi:HAD superfamily hydrolase (TIGR01549 family)
MPIQVVLFDLGSTLIYSREPWPPIYRRADRALVAVLQSAGIPVTPGDFAAEYDTFMDRYYARRDRGGEEPTSYAVLRELLHDNGVPSVPDPVLRAALDAEYAVLQANWHAEEDARPTLEALQARGYRLGMVSNTSDDKNVQQLVDNWGFRPFFEIIVTSAAVGIRKPDERIFQVALNHFGVPPAGAAMVGDMPSADLEGANRLGMFSIWITRRAPDPDPAIRPQASVATLIEIPDLLEQLRS